jgi:hypothetical protein
MKQSLSLPVLALLAACGMEGEEIPIGELPPVDACGAASLQSLVGQGPEALAAMSFDPATTRIFNEGDAITMDFSPTRLNIVSGGGGRIVRVYCG